MRILKFLEKHILKGLLYAAVFAVLGVLFSFIKGWTLLKGAYIFVLGAGVLTMVVSLMLLIGTPQMRKSIFMGSKKWDKNRGSEGIGPALMGIVITIIGFWLEAMTH
ncbi:hypothetical protein FQB35_01030 [Crassaminicella thermophila]|uniref:Uncharacterized protein n=1 Tax=Crassaminicella thermophila TaxID=2599308 RepID=A0A5C0SA87_CRATE|nr:hypothetical protein [Crassaminicella thermophila]QEK11061.1 hypothetical protein FQB35_01030 [Crassaminicella thermophila]